MGDVGKGTSVDKHRSAFCRWKDNSIPTFTSRLQILMNTQGSASFFEVGWQCYSIYKASDSFNGRPRTRMRNRCHC